nr:2-hydroxyacid dehydrogenase [Tissierella sp.]
MKNILTTMSEKSIGMFGIKPPEGFNISYIDSGYSDEEFIEKSKDADFLLMGLDRLNKNILDNLNQVKLIQSLGVGYDGIDVEAARGKGIDVANAKGVNRVSVSEHTIGLMLAALRRTAQSDRAIKNFKFEENYRSYQIEGTRTLKSAHVGIIGLGDIGIEVLKRLKAFESKVSYNSHSRKKDLEKEYGIDYLELDELLKTCDIVTIHTPLTDGTENMINKASLKSMKKDSILINTARGEIVNQEDLAEALIDGQIGMAALDTIHPEPPSSDHPLLNLPEDVEDKLILTSHIAGITTEDLKNMQINAWENIQRVADGEKPINIVN